MRALLCACARTCLTRAWLSTVKHKTTGSHYQSMFWVEFFAASPNPPTHAVRHSWKKKPRASFSLHKSIFMVPSLVCHAELSMSSRRPVWGRMSVLKSRHPGPSGTKERVSEVLAEQGATELHCGASPSGRKRQG